MLLANSNQTQEGDPDSKPNSKVNKLFAKVDLSEQGQVERKSASAQFQSASKNLFEKPKQRMHNEQGKLDEMSKPGNNSDLD